IFLACTDQFCPEGTFCVERYIVKCRNPPCAPIISCVPDEVKGCKNHEPCPSGEVCVERIVPCIARSCRTIAKCAKIGTCDAMACPPSHKCEMKPKPTCVKTIFSSDDVEQAIRQMKE
ncbi:unnamed protein product, partial [Dracunculus medinensis]|uniref:TIL domain-containing protein n=1 Tax=Dracunculus medinensis TaxID=318479 RepID=A0A0N4U4B1_DRAME